MVAQRWLFAVLVLCAGWALFHWVGDPDEGEATEAGPVEEARPPNIVLIMADDLGAAELGCYGHPTHRTPHIDALARNGVRFSTCYATPICHPSRFQILTGKYGHRTGTYNFMGRPGGLNVEDPAADIAGHTTLGSMLRAGGYATALVGKWQMSLRSSNRIRESGFDEYCIWGVGGDLPRGARVTSGREDASWKPEILRSGSKAPSRYWHPSIVANGRVAPSRPVDYGPDVFADFILEFVDRHRDEPFFVYYPMALTHAPYCPTPASVVEEEGEELLRHSEDNFGANVEYMDHLVGRIVGHLEELGIREDTVVLFTSDNGTFARGKARPSELGARVPLIVSGPGTAPGREACEELVDFSDILPTLAELAGCEGPGADEIDGLSFAGVLRGESPGPREWVFSYIADRRVLRTRRWLLEDNSPSEFGKLFDTGGVRDGQGYADVTASTTEEVQAIRRELEAILSGLPAPDLGGVDALEIYGQTPGG